MSHEAVQACEDVATGSAHDLDLRALVISSDTFPPRRVDVSELFGVELTRRGIRSDWVLQSEADCDRAYVTRWGQSTVWVGSTDNRDSLLARVHKHARGILNDLRVFQLARSSSYDLLIVKDKFLSGVVALLAARGAGKPYVYWLSWPFAEEYAARATDGTARYPLLYAIRGAVFRFLLYRMLLPAASHIIVQSEQMRRDIAAEGIAPDKMTAVPMGVQIHESTATSVAAGPRRIPGDAPSLLYLGTLTRIRRLDFLVRVLECVRRTLPTARLYFVGRGDDPRDEQLLRDEAHRLGVESAVVLTGQLPQAEAFAYVQEASVCVSPFFPTPILNSTSPTKLIEYMALGRPVVANDHPEQRQIIEESAAGICVPYDEASFADAVIELIRDPERAARMGVRGRSYVVAHRSYPVIADLVARRIRAIVVSGSRRARGS